MLGSEKETKCLALSAHADLIQLSFDSHKNFTWQKITYWRGSFIVHHQLWLTPTPPPYLPPTAHTPQTCHVTHTTHQNRMILLRVYCFLFKEFSFPYNKATYCTISCFQTKAEYNWEVRRPTDCQCRKTNTKEHKEKSKMEKKRKEYKYAVKMSRWEQILSSIQPAR